MPKPMPSIDAHSDGAARRREQHAEPAADRQQRAAEHDRPLVAQAAGERADDEADRDPDR